MEALDCGRLASIIKRGEPTASNKFTKSSDVSNGK